MNDELEQEVQKAIGKLYEKYQVMNKIVDQMLSKQGKQDLIAEDLLSVAHAKSEITRVESETQEIRNQYKLTRPNASAQVNQLTQNACDLLVQVRDKIARLESITRQEMDKLTPKVNEGVRATQMKQAYGGGR